MDRVANLEALEEEAEDEDPAKHQKEAAKEVKAEQGDSSDSDSDDGDGGIRKEDPNKFEGLCDGVVNSLALVHGNMTELLELKDELLRHSLPPNVLMKIALSTTKVFRSVVDMHMPVNELVRLVKLYSTPWEEKSAALQKLHEDYESKKNQLNIAVKRLQLIDAHSRRIARERRIMNWEKLFSRLTTTRGQGRRWKFLIESFKKKASQGVGALQAYVDEMEKRTDSDNEEEAELDKDIVSQMAQMTPTPSELQREAKMLRDGEDSGEDSGDEESEDEETEVPVKAVTPVKEIIVEVNTYVKPITEDAQVWTHEPEYDRQLHIRVFKPEGLDFRELKCVLTCGGQQYHKTGFLDQIEKTEEDDTPVPDEAGSSPTKGRGRLIGSRGSKTAGAAGGLLLNEDLARREKETPRFEQVSFTMEPEAPKGILSVKEDGIIKISQNIKIAVHYGQKEEMIAMATIDMDDLRSLDLPALYTPEEGISKSSENQDQDELVALTEAPDDAFPNMEPMNFPLYPVEQSGPSGALKSNGRIPLACFWRKQLRRRTMDKATVSESVTDIIYDETGFDMNVMTKEDLHKDLIDECLSAPRFTPVQEEPQEDTVLRTDYERMKEAHKDEMEQLADEYEDRMQQMMNQMQQMQESMEAQATAQLEQAIADERARPRSSRSPKRVQSPHVTHDVISPRPPDRAKTVGATPSNKPPKIRFPGKPPLTWSENLPKDFLERLAMFEEQSQQHKQELTDKVGKEASDKIERTLAGAFRLSAPDEILDVLEDVSLPAVFMPNKSNNMKVYNPRAHNYFHTTGSAGARLTQPPSMVQLPPIPKNKMSVVNLFDVSQNFQRAGGQDWLMQRYLQAQASKQNSETQSNGERLDNPVPLTPAPTYASKDHTHGLAQYQDTRDTIMSEGSQKREAMIE